MDRPLFESTEDWLLAIFQPNAGLLVATLVLALLFHGGPVGPFLGMCLWTVAFFVDMRMQQTIPSELWGNAEGDQEEAITSAISAGMFGLFAFALFCGPSFSFVLFALLVANRIGTVAWFCLNWYDVYQGLLVPQACEAKREHTLETLAYRNQLADGEAKLAEHFDRQQQRQIQAESHREKLEREAARLRAIQDARSAVMRFFHETQNVIARHIMVDQLLVEIRAAIPDTATEQDAFQGAQTLIEKLKNFHAQEQQSERRQLDTTAKREAELGQSKKVIDEIDRRIDQLRHAKSDDADWAEAEIEALRRKRQAVLDAVPKSPKMS